MIRAKYSLVFSIGVYPLSGYTKYSLVLSRARARVRGRRCGMNGANVEKVYRLCQKRERDRERQQRKSKRKGQFRNVVHLVDFEKAEAAENSPAWLSDNGKGANDIIAHCDGETGKTRCQRILRNARDRLRRAHPELVEVFDLIMENGANRKESIWALTQTK